MKTVHLLTIGNSFSDNALTYLERIAEGTETVRFDVGRANLGGCSLEKHWNLAQYTARQPEFKTYNVRCGADGKPVQVNLQEALADRPWDIVTLQQVSTLSWRRESFELWLGQLHEMIRTLAPQAKVMLHQTWAYRADTPFYPENGITQEIMKRRICENFEHYAAMYRCGILRSGEAIDRARRAPGKTFTWPEADYDYQQAEAPRLPRQDHSLAVGWQWRITRSANGIPELARDSNHLNARGCYLCGAVWFEALTGLNIQDNRYTPDELEAEDVAFLRKIAHTTLTE